MFSKKCYILYRFNITPNRQKLKGANINYAATLNFIRRWFFI